LHEEAAEVGLRTPVQHPGALFPGRRAVAEHAVELGAVGQRPHVGRRVVRVAEGDRRGPLGHLRHQRVVHVAVHDHAGARHAVLPAGGEHPGTMPFAAASRSASGEHDLG